MSDDQLNDLKQFIDSRVSQSEQRIMDDVRGGLQKLEQKVDDGFAGIGDALDETQERQEQFDLRLTKLEQKAA